MSRLIRGETREAFTNAYLHSTKSVERVAAEHGVSSPTVSKHLKAMGKQPVRLKKDGTPWGKARGRLSTVQEKAPEIVAAWKKNPNAEQVAIQVGLSANSVLKAVKAAGCYEVRRPGSPRKIAIPTAGPKAP